MRALVKEYGVTVDCVYWDQQKRTPFLPADEEGITFHKRSSFDEASLSAFVDGHHPALIYVVGRMDKLYLKTVRLLRNKTIVVTGSDNQWTGSIKQKISSLFSAVLYRRYFEYFWVPGRRQAEFARRMGYPAAKIIPNLLTADTAVFEEAYAQNCMSKKAAFPHTIVYAGRFAKVKGLDVLVAAFAEAKSEE